jgi:hypothetical protein
VGHDTEIINSTFEPEEKWEYYLWNSERGVNKDVIIPPTQKWDDLKALALESSGKAIPELIKAYPIPYLCFLCVFPHRLNSSGIRWLDTELRKLS